MEAIQEDFISINKFKPIKIFSVKSVTPLFMVVTDDTWTIVKLNRDVPILLKPTSNGRTGGMQTQSASVDAARPGGIP